MEWLDFEGGKRGNEMFSASAVILTRAPSGDRNPTVIATGTQPCAMPAPCGGLDAIIRPEWLLNDERSINGALPSKDAS